MSARREHRLRKMERRVEYLENLARINEARLHDIEKLAASPVMIVKTTDQEDAPEKTKRSLFQRIKEIFTFA